MRSAVMHSSRPACSRKEQQDNRAGLPATRLGSWQQMEQQETQRTDTSRWHHAAHAAPPKQPACDQHECTCMQQLTARC